MIVSFFIILRQYFNFKYLPVKKCTPFFLNVHEFFFCIFFNCGRINNIFSFIKLNILFIFNIFQLFYFIYLRLFCILKLYLYWYEWIINNKLNLYGKIKLNIFFFRKQLFIWILCVTIFCGILIGMKYFFGEK